MKYPCDTANLGLTDDELAGLTGFTLPMVRMVAHLREAWLQADDGNARALISGFHQMLLFGHSFGQNQRIITKVLSAGLDTWQQAKLLTELGLEGLVEEIIAANGDGDDVATTVWGAAKAALAKARDES